MELESRQVDWQKELEEWELTCPFCDGTSYKNWEELDEDEKKEVKEEFKEMGNKGEIKDFYEAKEEDFEFHCDSCQEGYLEMYWNTAWKLGYMGGYEALDQEKRLKAMKETNCHIVFNREEDEWYITLSGCGMDLTPEVCRAWQILGFKWLPLDWVLRLSKGYGANLAEEDYKEVLKLATYTLESTIETCESKIKELK